MHISELRTRINTLDDSILTLLKERMDLSPGIAEYKDENSLSITDLEREKALLQRLQETVGNRFTIDPIWQEIMFASKRLQHKHLQEKKNIRSVRIGIQGGKGSFNEIALKSFLEKKPEMLNGKEVEITYLYTTESVLQALNDGAIEFGQFAIANSIGGLVDETMRSIGSKRFQYSTHYEIPVEHALMIHADADVSKLDTVMAHDQALRQCANNIAEYFPALKSVPGTGELTDNASVAEAVANGTLPKTTASIGHKSLADIYGLRVLRENMQDRSDNRTTFVLVSL